MAIVQKLYSTVQKWTRTYPKSKKPIWLGVRKAVDLRNRTSRPDVTGFDCSRSSSPKFSGKKIVARCCHMEGEVDGLINRIKCRVSKLSRADANLASEPPKLEKHMHDLHNLRVIIKEFSIPHIKQWASDDYKVKDEPMDSEQILHWNMNAWRQTWH